jgi:hypothetical protein
MAGRRFEVADVVEVLQHWQAGRSQCGIWRAAWAWAATECGVIIGAATAAEPPGFPGRFRVVARGAAADPAGVGGAGPSPVRRPVGADWA